MRSDPWKRHGPRLPDMTAPQTGNREFRDQVVTVSSLVVTGPMIENYTFINCRIVGPAVLGIVDGVSFEYCNFEAEVDAFYWEVDPDTRPLVVGAVGLFNVRFVSCTFQAIGIAGTAEFRQRLEASMR